jgi:hypothetical protein
MAEDEESGLPAQLIAPIVSNAELDRLIADLGRHPLAKGELRQIMQGLYISSSKSQAENLDFAFCLSSGDLEGARRCGSRASVGPYRIRGTRPSMSPERGLNISGLVLFNSHVCVVAPGMIGVGSGDKKCL